MSISSIILYQVLQNVPRQNNRHDLSVRAGGGCGDLPKEIAAGGLVVPAAISRLVSLSSGKELRLTMSCHRAAVARSQHTFLTRRVLPGDSSTTSPRSYLTECIN